MVLARYPVSILKNKVAILTAYWAWPPDLVPAATTRRQQLGCGLHTGAIRTLNDDLSFNAR